MSVIRSARPRRRPAAARARSRAGLRRRGMSGGSVPQVAVDVLMIGTVAPGSDRDVGWRASGGAHDPRRASVTWVTPTVCAPLPGLCG